jgi:hypothetical protein
MEVGMEMALFLVALFGLLFLAEKRWLWNVASILGFGFYALAFLHEITNWQIGEAVKSAWMMIIFHVCFKASLPDDETAQSNQSDNNPGIRY